MYSKATPFVWRGLYETLKSFLPIVMPAFMLPRWLHDELVAAAQAGFPEEVCGLVAGKNGLAMRFYPIENIHHSPVSYEMNPLEQIEAMLAMEADGMELLAIFHSHPNGPAYPSATDIAQAFYSDALQILISLDQARRASCGVFIIRDGAVTVVDWEIAPDDQSN